MSIVKSKSMTFNANTVVAVVWLSTNTTMSVVASETNWFYVRHWSLNNYCTSHSTTNNCDLRLHNSHSHGAFNNYWATHTHSHSHRSLNYYSRWLHHNLWLLVDDLRLLLLVNNLRLLLILHLLRLLILHLLLLGILL